MSESAHDHVPPARTELSIAGPAALEFAEGAGGSHIVIVYPLSEFFIRQTVRRSTNGCPERPPAP